MSNAVLQRQLHEIQFAFQQIGSILSRIANNPIPPPASPLGAAPTPSDFAGPAQPLTTFLQTVEDLEPNEMKAVVGAARNMLANVYVHLSVKCAMYGIDPLQRLASLKSHLETKTARQFHDEMIEIFHSLRDLHTSYHLPLGYRDRIAFLPFLVEECVDEKSARRIYLVTRWLDRSDPTIPIGSAICDWNGVPIDRAVEIVAAREAGSNDDARHARGLDSFTIRPMEMTAPPDEEWVTVGFKVDDQRREARFGWQVVTLTPSPSGVADAGRATAPTSRMLGVDARSEAIRRTKKTLFFPGAVADERRMEAAAGTVPTSTADDDQTKSRLPDVFKFRRVAGPKGELGYIRIYTFSVRNADAFVAEFVRIAELLPPNGLIVDVRNNPGGIILAGERLLQVLTSVRIEPERFQFISSGTTQKLCEKDPELSRWLPSIKLSVDFPDAYSQGLSLEPADNYNRIGRKYGGKVLLITDALCYSTTDIFAAGFQDHKIGKILGVQTRTGAGGANVWSYGDLREALPDDFSELPKGVSFSVALRRCTRVKENEGLLVEDYGVRADDTYSMTSDDLLGDNVKLIAAAAKMLANG